MKSDAPIGTEGASIARTIAPRTVRCPKCRQFFETHRRWSMFCPECRHEWEETSHRGVGDRIRDLDIFGRLVMAAMWLALAGIVGFFIYALLHSVLQSNAARTGGLAAILLIVAVIVLYALVYRFSMRPCWDLINRFARQWVKADSDKEHEQRS